MQLVNLTTGEKFKFNNDTWTKLRCVSKYTFNGEKRSIFDCMNSEGRHRPFDARTEIEPCQMRLEVENEKKRR